MPWGKVIVTVGRAAVRYGPAAKVVYDQAREPAVEFARTRVEQARQRRLAVEKARTLRDGMLLKVIPDETPIWVVFAGDVPVSAHPDTGVPLDELLRHADLGHRVYPDQVPSARERAVAARDSLRDSAADRVRRRRG